jgi:acetyl-CoA acetyltransferase
MNDVCIIGTGMTPFAKSPGSSLRSLAEVAVAEALADTGVRADSSPLSSANRRSRIAGAAPRARPHAKYSA